MRVLLPSWEYPPGLVGGHGRHVHRPSVALAARVHGVRVVRAAEYPPQINDPFSRRAILGRSELLGLGEGSSA